MIKLKKLEKDLDLINFYVLINFIFFIKKCE